MAEALFELVERDGWRFVVKKKKVHSTKPRELVDPLTIIEDEELQAVAKGIERLERLVSQKPNPITTKPKFRFDQYGQGLLPFDAEVIDSQSKNSRDVVQEKSNRVDKSGFQMKLPYKTRILVVEPKFRFNSYGQGLLPFFKMRSGVKATNTQNKNPNISSDAIQENYNGVNTSKFQMRLPYKEPRNVVVDAKSLENPISKYLDEHGVGYYVMELKPVYRFDKARRRIRNFGGDPPNSSFLVQRIEGRYMGIHETHSFQLEVLGRLCNILYRAIEADSLRQYSRERIGMFWSK